jgi:hypothetical protein
MGTVPRMTRLLPILAAATIGGAGLGASVSASADPQDQETASAAIAAFNEQMTEAGGESSGPPDTTPIDPEEFAEENPGSECFGEFATALDPGGHVEGETARADSDHFSLSGDEGTDEIDAAVVVVDEDHADTVRDFVEQLGSDELESCLQDAFNALLETEVAAAEEASGTTLADDIGTIEVEAEPDIGVGDASAHVRLTSVLTYDEVTYTSSLDLYAAASDRSFAAITVQAVDESATDFDPVAALEALIDAL